MMQQVQNDSTSLKIGNDGGNFVRYPSHSCKITHQNDFIVLKIGNDGGNFVLSEVAKAQFTEVNEHFDIRSAVQNLPIRTIFTLR